MLVGEYVLTTLLVDARDLARGFALPALRYLGESARGLALVLGATVLYGGPSLLHALRSPVAAERSSGPTRWLLPAHLVTFALLTGLTNAVAYGPFGGAPLFVVWLVLGGLSVGFLTRYVVPIERLRLLRAPLGRALGAGVLAGGAAWLVGYLATFLWPLVSEYTLRLAAAQLHVVASQVTVDPEEMRLGVGTFSVLIAPVCSGLEGVGLALVLAGAYVLHARASLRMPNALLLVPLSAAAVWLANTTRIALLVLVGARISPAIAVGGFHSKAGWVFFCVIAFAVVWVSRALPFFARRDRSPTATAGGENPTLPYLAPLIVLLATMMVTGLFAPGHVDPLYFARVVSVLAVVWAMRARYPAGTFAPSLFGVAVGVVSFGAWLLLSHHGGPTSMPHELAATSPALRALWIAGRVLGAAVAVPIAEELAFRGFLLRRLQSPQFDPDAPPRLTLLGVGGSSVVFASLHGTEWLAALVAAMIFAFGYIRRGRLGDAVWAHGICNALVALWVLTRGAWGLW